MLVLIGELWLTQSPFPDVLLDMANAAPAAISACVCEAEGLVVLVLEVGTVNDVLASDTLAWLSRIADSLSPLVRI